MTPLLSKARRPAATPYRRVLWGAVLLVDLCVLAMMLLSLRQSRELHQERARITAQNLSQVLERNLDGWIARIDLTLRLVEDEDRRLSQSRPFDTSTFNASLARLRSRLPFLDVLRAADTEGYVAYGSPAAPLPKVYVGDRAYYQRLREGSSEFLITEPLQSRVSNKWVVVFARRLSAPDGAFRGVAYAQVTLEELNHLFAGIDVGPHGSIGLRDAGEKLLARFPSPLGASGPVIAKNPPQAFRDFLRSGGTFATYTAPSGVDNVERTFCTRRIGPHPLYIIVGLATQDYLASWRHEARKVALLGGLFMLVTALAAAFLQYTWQRHLRALENLALQERRFHLLFDSAGDAITLRSQEGRILEANGAACITMGFTREEMLGLTAAEVEAHFGPLPPDGDQQVTQEMGLLETTKTTRHGERLEVEVRRQWVDYGGRRVLLSLARDISARKRLARMKDEFVSTVSHELRTPLTSIRGSLSLLDQGVGGALSPDAENLVGLALKNAQRLGLLINDLLDIQRLEGGSLALLSESLDLPGLVDEVLLMDLPFAQAHGIRFLREGEVGPLSVHGDAHRLKQVLSNLLSNAAKFSPEGSTVRIRLKGSPTWARVEVQDQGPGIPPEFHPRIFQRFAQADAGDARERGGTGLGLSISKAIIDAHGGAIGFDCPEGGGSIFWFELPR